MSEETMGGRRGFLAGGAALGAAVGAGLLVRPAQAQTAQTTGRRARANVAVLKFLAAAELVESDLWLQYEELARNNRDFRAALFDIDEGLPDYAIDTQEDEESHASFINAYLASIGEQPPRPARSSRRVMPRAVRLPAPRPAQVLGDPPLRHGQRRRGGGGHGLVNSGLFAGQPPAFFNAVVALAQAADGA